MKMKAFFFALTEKRYLIFFLAVVDFFVIFVLGTDTICPYSAQNMKYSDTCHCDYFCNKQNLLITAYNFQKYVTLFSV